MTPRDKDGPEDDELLPRLFRALGPTPSLPAEMRRGWEAAFGAELTRRIAAKRQRRNRLVGVCASLAVALAAALYMLQESVTSDIAAVEVARVALAVGRVEATSANATKLLDVGAELRAGQTLRTGPDGLLALNYRDADVRLNSKTAVALLPTYLRLEQGDVYVDSGIGPHRGPSVMIETPRGILTHVGTQFAVSVDHGEVRAAVREGAVAFTSDGEHRTVSADDGPTEILISAAGVTTKRIAGNGNPWNWIVVATPGFVVDGRTADELLVWATRQTGAQLRYADDATRFHSHSVILHGSLGPLSVAQGIAALNATTGLDVDESDPSVLRVSLRRNSP